MLDLLKNMAVLSRWRLAATLACVLAGCEFPGQPDPANQPVRADRVVDFDHLFHRNCAGCHGAEGKRGPAPPLNDPIFLSIVPDAELLGVIAEGRPGTPMAAFASERGGPLYEAQIKALATGLKSRWKSPVSLRDPVPSYLAAEQGGSNASTENLKSGASAFARACATCHGDRGEGTDRAGAICDPAFLRLISDQALRRLIITGRSDLGMPNFADNKRRGSDYQPLSSTEIDALVALLSSWRQNTSAATPVATTAPAARLSIASEGEPQ